MLVWFGCRKCEFLELDDVCTCSEANNRLKRRELEQLREEEIKCEAKRLAQLVEQEANKKEIAQQKAKLEEMTRKAESEKNVVEKTKQEIVKLGEDLEVQANSQLKEQRKLKEQQEQIEKEKSRAREERQKLRKKREQQKIERQVHSFKQKADEEELRNERRYLMLERQKAKSALMAHKMELEKKSEIEKDIYQTEVENMRKFVHKEVATLRSMAGMDMISPAITKDQKEAENEFEALEGLENDRLMLKDITEPEAPVLPEKYLQATMDDTRTNIPSLHAEQKVFTVYDTSGSLTPLQQEDSTVLKDLNHKFERLELEEVPLNQWKPEDVMCKVKKLCNKVEEMHSKVCECLKRKYNSVLSCDDKTHGLSQEMIDEFACIKPLFEQLEKAIAVEEQEKVSEKLRHCDHALCTIDHLLQIHELIKCVETSLKASNYLESIEKLDAVYNLMANLDVESENEKSVKSCLKVELCLLREKLLYSLNETWNDLFNWDLPTESKRYTAKSKTVTLKISKLVQDPELLECTVQAMTSVNVLESRLKVFCDRVMTYIIQPLVTNENSVIEFFENNSNNKNTPSNTDLKASNCSVNEEHYVAVDIPTSQNTSTSCAAINTFQTNPVKPELVLQRLEQFLIFLHKPLHNIIVHDDSNMSHTTANQSTTANNDNISKRNTVNLFEKIGMMMSHRLFDCIYHDCLSYFMPKTSRQFDSFVHIITATEHFKDVMKSLNFFGNADETNLMEYLNDVNKLFANVKGQEMLNQAHELLSQELNNGIRISQNHPLGGIDKVYGRSLVPSALKSNTKPGLEDEVQSKEEHFVLICKEFAGTLNLNLPNCKISTSVQSLMTITYGTMKRALSSSSSAEVVEHMINSVHSMFELYCDVVPSYHRERLQNVPTMAALHHNNCMFISHHLITIDKYLQKKLKEYSNAQTDLQLQYLTSRVRKMGNEHFTEHINVKKEELCDKLIEAEGFDCVEDDNGESANLAIKHMMHHLKNITFVWKDILPVNVYCRAAGSLLNAAVEDIVDSVLSIEEFSVNDCNYLKDALTRIAVVAPQFFQLEELPMSPQVVLHENVPSWLRFKEIVILLASGLQVISDRWADGKGPLSMYLSSDEVRGMVIAMFENTPKREKILKEISKPSVSSLPQAMFPMKRMKSSPL